MALEAARLLRAAQAGHAAVARDPQYAEDDVAFSALAAAGTRLLAALDMVNADRELWRRVRSAAGRAPLPAEERDALEALLDAELAAVLEALSYQPPPPAHAFIEETLNAASRVLSSQLADDDRVDRVSELQYQVAKFSYRLRGLVEDRGLAVPVAVKRRRLRRAVYRGSGAAAALAVAAVGVGVETGLGAVGTGEAAAQFSDRVGEAVAQASCERARSELLDGLEPDSEVVSSLAVVDPVARQKAFVRVLEGRLARGAAGLVPVEETVDLAAADLRRIERCIARMAVEAPELITSLRETEQCLRHAGEQAAAGASEQAREALTQAGAQAQWLREISDPAYRAQTAADGAV